MCVGVNIKLSMQSIAKYLPI